jgi:outer membrane protein assembly factor BamB
LVCRLIAILTATTSAVVLSTHVTAQTRAAEWTQFGGPHRNFTVDEAEARLALSWPATGPKQLWRRPLGEGFSAVAAYAGTLFTLYQRGEQEVVIALDAATGKTKWEAEYTAPITVNMSRAPGPRATPLIIGDAVYTVGATGRLHRLDAKTGKVVWGHDLFTEFKGHVQDEYYAASPLAYRNTIIVPVGAPGGSVMAFDQQTGAVVWKALDFKTSYASPILIDVDGQQQAVLMMENEVIGIDPATGALLWKHPHANRTRTNVSTPVWGPGNLLFCSSAYDSGGRVLKLTRKGDTTTVEELWYSRDIRVHTGNAVRIGDTLYASSGDFGPTTFAAVDVMTGKPRWAQRDVPKVSFINVNGRFIMLNEDGELMLASPRASGLDVQAKAQVLEKISYTPPTLAGTTLFLRDRKEIVALDLGAR